MNRAAILLLVAAALVLAAAPGTARAGTAPKPPKPQPEVKLPPGWVACPKCGTHYPKNMPCPNCPPSGWEKCPECGAFHMSGRKCASCAQQKIPLREALCPVCRRAFNGPISFNRNAKGGMDRDFCRHSQGKNVVESLVWTCPRCGHTHWCSEIRDGKEHPGRFNEAVDAKYAEAVNKEVQPQVAKLLVDEVGRTSAKLQKLVSEMDQADIPDWIKYEAGLRCAGLRGESNAVLAKLALEGIYACRREMVAAVDIPALSSVIPPMEGLVSRQGVAEEDPRTVTRAVVDILRLAEQAERNNARGALSAWEKYYLYLRLAGCWDRLGDPRLAADALDEAVKAANSVRVDPKVAKPLEDLAEHRRQMLKREGEFRTRAIGWLRKALIEDNAYPGGAVAPTVYLLGELHRRQGEYGKARAWLVLAAKIAGKGQVLHAMVSETMKLPSMAGAALDENEEAAALALVVKLTGKTPAELIGPEPEPGPVGPPAGVTGKPADLAACLANIYKAYAAYVEKHRAAPEEAAELVKGGFITAEAAADFKCPECGTALRYRRPKKPAAADELLLWHPRAAGCRQQLLYADGKVKEGR